MESSLHRHDILSSKLTEYQFARMSLNGRHREIRYLLIWELVRISYLGS